MHTHSAHQSTGVAELSYIVYQIQVRHPPLERNEMSPYTYPAVYLFLALVSFVGFACSMPSKPPKPQPEYHIVFQEQKVGELGYRICDTTVSFFGPLSSGRITDIRELLAAKSGASSVLILNIVKLEPGE